MADELDLLVRAAEASAAAGDAGRAEAFMESAIARHPDPGDRPAQAELIRRLGSYRLAGGDRDGAVAAFDRALELLPGGSGGPRPPPGPLAQLRMLEGSFTEAERLAEAGIQAAEEAGPDARAWLGHATCTRGVVDGWLGRNDRAVERLEAALAIAVDLGRLEDAFRARANLTTILDLQGRREEVVEVARQGIEAADGGRSGGGPRQPLRGNAAEFLVSLGRWREARELAERALDWAPSGFLFVNAALRLAVVEAETAAGDAAVRLLGRVLLELETVPDVQFAAPAYQAAASLALWRGDVADAVRSIDAAWARVRVSEDWAIAARTAAVLLTVADAARASPPSNAGISRTSPARGPGPTTSFATRRAWWSSRGPRRRLGPARGRGRPRNGAGLRAPACTDATTRAWDAVAARWGAVGRPYERAQALHRLVEADLEAGHPAGERRAAGTRPGSRFWRQPRSPPSWGPGRCCGPWRT